MYGKLRHPLCPAGHLPHQGGENHDPPTELHSSRWIAARNCGRSVSPLVGERPGRAEGVTQFADTEGGLA